MHAHAALLDKLYSGLNRRDHALMASCYHPEATFQDIAFDLRGKKSIHAMWHMIAETDIRASFEILHADDQGGTVDLVDDYTFRDTGRPVHNPIRSEFGFRDGLIISHRDSCDELRWGIQALGPVKGVLSWLIPATRRGKADKKLKAFIAKHPEYA